MTNAIKLTAALLLALTACDATITGTAPSEPTACDLYAQYYCENNAACSDVFYLDRCEFDMVAWCTGSYTPPTTACLEDMMAVTCEMGGRLPESCL